MKYVLNISARNGPSSTEISVSVLDNVGDMDKLEVDIFDSLLRCKYMPNQIRVTRKKEPCTL